MTESLCLDFTSGLHTDRIAHTSTFHDIELSRFVLLGLAEYDWLGVSLKEKHLDGYMSIQKLPAIQLLIYIRSLALALHGMS